MPNNPMKLFFFFGLYFLSSNLLWFHAFSVLKSFKLLFASVKPCRFGNQIHQHHKQLWCYINRTKEGDLLYRIWLSLIVTSVKMYSFIRSKSSNRSMRNILPWSWSLSFFIYGRRFFHHARLHFTKRIRSKFQELV